MALEPVAVCFCKNTLVELVVISVTKQFQPFVAVGKVTTHPADVGVVPTLIVNAAVPLVVAMLAAAPPHPPAAIVGAVSEMSTLGVSRLREKYKSRGRFTDPPMSRELSVSGNNAPVLLMAHLPVLFVKNERVLEPLVPIFNAPLVRKLPVPLAEKTKFPPEFNV